MLTDLPKLNHNIKAISIVDEYLEHARVFMFHHGGEEKIFISSADWMVRNLDHRIEATCPIDNGKIKVEYRKNKLGKFEREHHASTLVELNNTLLIIDEAHNLLGSSISDAVELIIKNSS